MRKIKREFQEIILNKIQLSVSQKFSNSALDSMKVNVVDSVLTDDFTMYLEMFVAGQQTIQTYKVTNEFPKNWWEHLKQSFPKWYIKKYPVKLKKHTQSITFNHKALFPKMDMPQGQIVRWYTPVPWVEGASIEAEKRAPR